MQPTKALTKSRMSHAEDKIRRLESRHSQHILEQRVDVLAQASELSRRFVGSDFEARLRRWVNDKKISANRSFIREILDYMHAQIDDKVQSKEYDDPFLVEARVNRWAKDKKISKDHSFICEFLDFIHTQIDEKVRRIELKVEWEQKGWSSS